MAIALTYSGNTFIEAAGNNGAIATSVTITLAEDTFTGANGAALGTVTNVPTGLTAVLVKTSATTAKLSFTGNATAHADLQDIANLTVTFGNSDFTGGNAAAVTDATQAGLTIDFNDPAIVGTLLVNAPNAAIGNTRPLLTGAASKVGAEVHIFNGTKDLGKATVDTAGLWTFQVPDTVKDGTISFTAKELVAGTTTFGPPSAAVNYTLDTKIPTAPTVSTFKLPTSDNTPTLTGTAEKGATVEVTATKGSTATVLGTATADANGAWTLTVANSDALVDGDHVITSTATDAATNKSPASRAVTVKIDTAITTPTFNTAGLDLTTKVATQTLAGTTEPGAKVQIYGGADGSVALGKAIVADKNGAWKASVKLTDGVHILSVVATDLAGNISANSATKTVTIDTFAPVAPVLTPLSSFIAKTLPNTLEGTAEKGAMVDVYAGSTKLGSVTADSSGAWSFTTADFTGTLKDGVQKITAKATDTAGNVSKASAAVSFTIDNKAPTAPTVDAIKLPTDDDTPTLTGKAEKGASVEVFADGVSVGTTVADTTTGVWSVDATALAEKVTAITAKATDAAGNVSAATPTPMNLTVDKTAPIINTFTVMDGMRLSVKSNEAGTAGLYNDATNTLLGTAANLKADVAGAITVAAQTTQTTATLKVADTIATPHITSHTNKVVLGTAGHDTITITNGYTFTFGGNDTLVFNSLTVAGTIADYAVATDSIQLSKAVYTALGAIGALTTEEFVSGAGAVATTAAHRIVYNSTTGKLSYDADGNGSDAATLIGTFTGKPVLVVAEFSIVA